MDEEVQDVQEVEEQTTAEDSSPETNETADQQPKEETSQEAENQEATTDSRDGGNRTKNAQSRIRELVERNRELERQSQPPQEQQSPIGSSRFSELFKGKTEVTPEDLDATAEQYAAQTASSLLDQKLQPLYQQLQAERIASDVERVQAKHEELNPDSDNYDAALDQKLAEMYQKYGGGTQLADFVEEQLSIAEARANKQTAKTNQELNKQQDESALKPGTPRSETPFEALSEKEMEAKLGIVR